MEKLRIFAILTLLFLMQLKSNSRLFLCALPPVAKQDSLNILAPVVFVKKDFWLSKSPHGAQDEPS